MKFFILLLIIVALLQTTVIPINLCLVLLLCRSLIVSDKLNLYLGFFTGVFLGVLSSQNIGFYAITFLITLKVIQIFKDSTISANFLVAFPLLFAIYYIVSYLEYLFLSQSNSFSKVIAEFLLSIPVYILIRFSEERFFVQKHLKLKTRF